MIPALDFLIFGNGKGLGAPFFSQRFYWLVDRHTGRGAFYTWSGWFGSQLASFQWTHPNAGEERVLGGLPFRPFHSNRRWGRVNVAWSSPRLKTSRDIEEFSRDLGDGVFR